MDVSRQTNGEDTSCASASMYLSFDAESTVSSMAFKTLETSSISEMDLKSESSIDCESHMNSTLEAEYSLPNQSGSCQPQTAIRVERAEGMTLAAPMPWRACPKNILQEYKALCSTPTKEQLLRSVEIARGSSVEGCMDLGLAFLGVDEDRQNAFFPSTLPVEDNKENALLEGEEGSTLSVSSSMEIATSVIERKITLSATNEDKSLSGLKEENVKILDLLVEEVETTPVIVIDKVTAVKEKLASKAVPDAAAVEKPRRSILAPKNTRKTICEPDLRTNRPSRILANAKKRTSFAPQATNPGAENMQVSEIPKMLENMLKISDAKKTIGTAHAVERQTIALNENRKSMMPVGATSRPSKLPTTGGHAEKRPFSFTQRMSIVVKTTLNSPARKMARRSVLPNALQMRRSIMPSKANPGVIASDATDGMRKSMLPVGRTTKSTFTMTTTAASKALKEDAKKVESKLPVSRKSLYPTTTATASAAKVNSATQPTAIKPPHRPKTNVPNSFNCSICTSKFSLKSLLNAHMRSHEEDTPFFVKKPASAPNRSSSSNGSNHSLVSGYNQCKYCDKKFALTRALHIHLLQNCAKIPPGDKRKLHFTELNHVEKAQLPDFFHASAANSQNTSGVHSNSLVPAQNMMSAKSRSNLSSDPLSSTESLVEKKDITELANELVAAVDGVLTKMAPPAMPKSKKKPTTTAHSGVYRTPNKSVPCHLCKITFKNILDYTQHNMSIHAISSYTSVSDSSGECDKSSPMDMDLSSN